MNLSIRLIGCNALLPAVASAFHPLVTDDTVTQGAAGMNGAANETGEIDLPIDSSVDLGQASRKSRD